VNLGDSMHVLLMQSLGVVVRIDCYGEMIHNFTGIGTYIVTSEAEPGNKSFKYCIVNFKLAFDRLSLIVCKSKGGQNVS